MVKDTIEWVSDWSDEIIFKVDTCGLKNHLAWYVKQYNNTSRWIREGQECSPNGDSLKKELLHIKM